MNDVFNVLKIPIDILFVLLVTPAALVLRLFRRFGPVRLPRTTFMLKKIGIYPLRNHYYDPSFDERNLPHPLDQDRNLPGLDLNVVGQLGLLEKLVYSAELTALKLHERPKNPSAFYMSNDSFLAGDADILYQMIRHYKPKKILEIGSGNSTKIAQLALKRNKSESNVTAEHICVEPFEQPWLDAFDGITLIRDLIENTQIDWPNYLDAGDILFVDSSHMIRPQGDVLKEYLEIFPQLKSGVIVHVHDIFTPKNYPKRWLVEDIRFWNEQYLLEALLSNTTRYVVLAALNFLKHNHYAELSKACPYLTKDNEPGSFYFTIR